MSRRSRLCGLRYVASGLVLALAAAPLAGQGTCEVNNQASCVAAGSAAQGISVTITSVARLSVPLGDIVLPVPGVGSYDAGLGVAGSVSLTVQANVPWAVAISAATATWTGSPASARQNKPAGDAQWAIAAGGPFTDVTTVAATIQSGVATGAGVVTLFIRPRLDWTTDAPGSYTLPLQLTLTAP